jgi:hypothetical protein
MRILLAILIVGIIGTLIVKTAEHLFGVVNVFIFCTIVTAFVGIIYVPYKQLTKK